MRKPENSCPLVSIVIPVYNGADYLKEAIDSALMQDYENIEVLVINDGSKDDGATESVALSYGKKIRYFRKENGGVASALNFGLSQMCGEYFSWLSHDDRYYPDKISKQIEMLNNRNLERGIVFSSYDVYNMNNDMLTSFLPHLSYSIDKLETSVFSLLEGFLHFCSMLVPKEWLLECGGFDESLYATQDDEMCFKLFRKYPVIYSDRSACVVRLHENQGSKNLPNIQQEKEKLWGSFVTRLADEEKIAMYGSKKAFYYAMCCFFFSTNMKNAYQYVLSCFKMYENDKVGQEQKVRSYLKDRFKMDFSEICIFGAGRYGIRTAIDLLSKGIKVNSFCDNNEKLWNKEILAGIPCISIKDICGRKSEILVILSLKQQSEVKHFLEKENFTYVILREEIREVLGETEIEELWMEKKNH